MDFLLKLVFVFILFFSKLAFSANTFSWYATPQAAIEACVANHGNTQCHPGYKYQYLNNSNCSGSGSNFYQNWASTFDYYAACTQSFICPSGQEPVYPAGTCSEPPKSCDSKTSEIITQFSSPSQINLTTSSTKTLSKGGCEYRCSDSMTMSSDSTGFFINYLCTQTGVKKPESTKNIVTLPKDAKDLGAKTDGSVCFPNGSITTCFGGPIKAGCSTINGIESCPTNPNQATIAGNSIDSNSPKNCVQSGFNVVCAELENPEKKQQCGIVNDVKTCFATTPTVKTTETKIANPDGSTTTTKTTSDNILNSIPKIEAITSHPNGTTTTTITGGNKDSNGNELGTTGDGKQNGSGETDCDKFPDSIGCSKFGDATSTDKLETTEIAKTQLTTNSWGDGACPAPVVVTLAHTVQTFSYEPICQFAAKLRPVFIGFAYLAAGFIVVGGIQ